jgi:GNAT superfamily N-acetyltransferase
MATPSDLEFVRAVHHRAYRDVIELQYGGWSECVQDTYFRDAWSAAAHDIVLCDSIPCGYTGIDHDAAAIYVRELVIDPDFQGLGIGTHLVKDIQNQATARGVPVRLQTHIVNRAQYLYGRLGFRETSRTETHILMEWYPTKYAT